jgi:hypothetical protein
MGTGLAAVIGARLALADTFGGTRFDLQERVHDIDVRLEHGHATLVVTRIVENTASKSDQAVFFIDVPRGAVATRLRTAGKNARGEQVWFEGELMEAEAAASKYRELTGVGGYYPKDPALLSWRSQERLALQVFPVLGRSSKTVEYTLRMPMKYEDGAYRLELPRLGTESLPARIRFVAASPDEGVEVNGVAVAPGTRVVASRELEIKLRPRPALAVLEGALASHGFAKDRFLVHARLAASPRLGRIPAHASVVVLLDTSRSMEALLLEEIAAARAYLSYFPSADVEVMTFDRKVRSPFGGPLPVRAALARLSAFLPSAANGSAVDDAIAQADARLARSSSAERRLLVLTDLRTREAIDPEKLAARRLASGALVHVAAVESGDAELVRDDEHVWAKLPRATGGVLWRAWCPSRVDDRARAVFEEWVRPKRISRLVVSGMPDDFAAPSELSEGQGLEHLWIAKASVTKVFLTGELWSRPVRFEIRPSADEARRWAALVFGSDLLYELTEAEQMTLAMFGRAVSPVTSYLAIEPGVRPSTEGLEESEALGPVVSLTGFGQGSKTRRVFKGKRGDRQAILDRELAKAVHACGGAGEASATIETTVHEIVDVRGVALAGARDAKVEACVAEQLWSVLLPFDFDEEHRTWQAKSRS